MLEVRYVGSVGLPKGHQWMLVERDGVTVAHVLDGAAEKVARAVYSNSRKRAADSNASAIRATSAD